MIKRIGALVFALTLLFAFAVPASAAYDPDYTYYESMTASGSQYVNTGFYFTPNTRMVIDFNLGTLTKSFTFFGANSGTGDAIYSNVMYVLNGSLMFNAAGATVNLTSVYDVNGVNTMDFDLSAGKLTMNGTEFTLTNMQLSSSQQQPMYLFAYNNQGNVTAFSPATIYSCRIYDSGTLQQSLIPASNGSGVTGMWDLVNNEFKPNGSSTQFTMGAVFNPPAEEDSVAQTITNLNTQIHDIESAIYEDLHTYSAQVDPSTATNFSGNFLSAMSFISDTWTSAYNQLGDMQVIVTFPLFLAIAMLFIGRMNSVIASGAMKSRMNNDKKGGGDVG